VQGAALAVAMPLVPGVFRANAVVVITRYAGALALDVAVDKLKARYEATAEIEVVGDRSLTVSGFDCFHREVSFIEETAGTVAQAVSLIVIPRDNCTDLVEVTGTCSASQTK